MINLNYRDARPIYEQIRERLRDLIVTGGLSAGEKLPSVRELAIQLAINPNTIQRTYRELEADGYIYSVPGKGSFAAEGAETTGRRRRELQDELRRVAAELGRIGVTRAEMIRIIEEGGHTE